MAALMMEKFSESKANFQCIGIEKPFLKRAESLAYPIHLKDIRFSDGNFSKVVSVLQELFITLCGRNHFGDVGDLDFNKYALLVIKCWLQGFREEETVVFRVNWMEFPESSKLTAISSDLLLSLTETFSSASEVVEILLESNHIPIERFVDLFSAVKRWSSVDYSLGFNVVFLEKFLKYSPHYSMVEYDSSRMLQLQEEIIKTFGVLLDKIDNEFNFTDKILYFYEEQLLTCLLQLEVCSGRTKLNQNHKNHTGMSEAGYSWDQDDAKESLPEVLKMLKEEIKSLPSSEHLQILTDELQKAESFLSVNNTDEVCKKIYGSNIGMPKKVNFLHEKLKVVCLGIKLLGNVFRFTHSGVNFDTLLEIAKQFENVDGLNDQDFLMHQIVSLSKLLDNEAILEGTYGTSNCTYSHLIIERIEAQLNGWQNYALIWMENHPGDFWNRFSYLSPILCTTEVVSNAYDFAFTLASSLIGSKDIDEFMAPYFHIITGLQRCASVKCLNEVVKKSRYFQLHCCNNGNDIFGSEFYKTKILKDLNEILNKFTLDDNESLNQLAGALLLQPRNVLIQLIERALKSAMQSKAIVAFLFEISNITFLGKKHQNGGIIHRCLAEVCFSLDEREFEAMADFIGRLTEWNIHLDGGKYLVNPEELVTNIILPYLDVHPETRLIPGIPLKLLLLIMERVFQSFEVCEWGESIGLKLLKCATCLAKMESLFACENINGKGSSVKFPKSFSSKLIKLMLRLIIDSKRCEQSITDYRHLTEEAVRDVNWCTGFYFYDLANKICDGSLTFSVPSCLHKISSNYKNRQFICATDDENDRSPCAMWLSVFKLSSKAYNIAEMYAFANLEHGQFNLHEFVVSVSVIMSTSTKQDWQCAFLLVKDILCKVGKTVSPQLIPNNLIVEGDSGMLIICTISLLAHAVIILHEMPKMHAQISKAFSNAYQSILMLMREVAEVDNQLHHFCLIYQYSVLIKENLDALDLRQDVNNLLAAIIDTILKTLKKGDANDVEVINWEKKLALLDD
eukprot:gene12314-13584_t